MILPWTFNYMSGGPEYAKMYSEMPEERWRRHTDAAVLKPDRYCKNVARRAEMQCCGHWTALPIARNLLVPQYEMHTCLLEGVEVTASPSWRPPRS